MWSSVGEGLVHAHWLEEQAVEANFAPVDSVWSWHTHFPHAMWSASLVIRLAMSQY